MTPLEAFVAFSLAAGLLTVTPGLDTALVLRTAMAEGARRAVMAATGILMGLFCWGAIVAFGLGALLLASQTAYTVLKWAGAAYLVWLGLNLILKPRKTFDVTAAATPAGLSPAGWLRRGLINNLLNPKTGAFYVSFLPQFIPEGVATVPFTLLLVSVHAVEGVAWFGFLIASALPLTGLLKRAGVVRWLDRATGGLFVAFGVRLALERR